MVNRKSKSIKKKGGYKDCFFVDVNYTDTCNQLPLDKIYMSYKRGGKKRKTSLRKRK